MHAGIAAPVSARLYRQTAPPPGMAPDNPACAAVLSALRAGAIPDAGAAAAAATVACHDEAKRPPLVVAAWTGDEAALGVLLRAGHDPRAGDRHRLTPAHYAAWHGHTGCVAALLKAGARPDASDDFGVVPIHKAAGRGSPRSKRAARFQTAPLLPSASHARLLFSPRSPREAFGHPLVIRQLLRAAAPPGGDGAARDATPAAAAMCNARTDLPSTPPEYAAVSLRRPPLHYAVGSTWAVRAPARGECAGLLLAGGAEPNARDVNGDTALHVALASAAEVRARERGARARAFVPRCCASLARAESGRRLLGCPPDVCSRVARASGCSAGAAHRAADRRGRERRHAQRRGREAVRPRVLAQSAVRESALRSRRARLDAAPRRLREAQRKSKGFLERGDFETPPGLLGGG